MQSGGDAARSTLLAAIELARRVDDPDLLGRAALSLGGFGLSPGMVDDDLVAVLEEALHGLPPDGSALRARLLVRLAVALYYSDQAQRREDLVQEALGHRARARRPADAGLRPRPGPHRHQRPRHRRARPGLGPRALRAGRRRRRPRALGPRALVADRPPARARRPRGRRHGDRGARPHRHRLARPARPRLHPAAPRAAGHDRRAARRHRGAHPRGHPAGLEPAGLDRAHPGRRPALLAAHGPGPPARDRGRGAPVRRSAPGHARLARRAGHALHAHRPPRGGAPRVRPPRRAGLRDHPARQRLVDLDRAAGRAERDLPRRRALDRCSRSCSRPSKGATSSRPRASSPGRCGATSR